MDLGAAADRQASWTTVMASRPAAAGATEPGPGVRHRPDRSLTENYAVLLDKV